MGLGSAAIHFVVRLPPALLHIYILYIHIMLYCLDVNYYIVQNRVPFICYVSNIILRRSYCVNNVVYLCAIRDVRNTRLECWCGNLRTPSNYLLKIRRMCPYVQNANRRLVP